MSIRVSLSVLTLSLVPLLPLCAQNPEHTLYFGAGSVNPGADIDVHCFLDTLDGEIIGWSWGVCHDPALATVNTAGHGATTATANFGNPPHFSDYRLYPDGWTVGVVICFPGACNPIPVIDPGVGYDLAVASYTVDIDATEDPALCYCDTLGTPNVSTLVVVAPQPGTNEFPTLVCGSIELLASHDFVRGDCNGDGGHDISDAVFGLEALFSGGQPPSCVEGCDANDDGGFNISDMIYILSGLFSGGPPPPAPYPGCGPDPTEDSLECETFPPCP